MIYYYLFNFTNYILIADNSIKHKCSNTVKLPYNEIPFNKMFCLTKYF